MVSWLPGRNQNLATASSSNCVLRADSITHKRSHIRIADRVPVPSGDCSLARCSGSHFGHIGAFHRRNDIHIQCISLSSAVLSSFTVNHLSFRKKVWSNRNFPSLEAHTSISPFPAVRNVLPSVSRLFGSYGIKFSIVIHLNSTLASVTGLPSHPRWSHRLLLSGVGQSLISVYRECGTSLLPVRYNVRNTLVCINATTKPGALKPTQIQYRFRFATHQRNAICHPPRLPPRHDYHRYVPNEAYKPGGQGCHRTGKAATVNVDSSPQRP